MTALWSDVAFNGGGASVRVPTMDAALPAMCTPDPAKAAAALRQLTDPARFGAPYGPRFVPSWEPRTTRCSTGVDLPGRS